MDISATAFVARLFGLPIAFAIDPFAPLLVFGFSRRGGLIHDPYLLQPAFDGFASDGFLAVVLLLYIAHIIGDKVPPIAHALDAVYLLLKPLAAALVGFWMADALDVQGSLHVVTLAIVILGSLAVTAGVHAVRSTMRLAASAGTFGFAVPFISTIENALGMVTAVLVVLRPEVALVLFLVVGLPMGLLLYAVVKSLRRGLAALRAGRRTRRGRALAR